MALTSCGEIWDAWAGVMVGVPPAEPPRIRPSTPPATPDIAPGPIDCTSWFNSPACCCGLRCPNRLPTDGPNAGVALERNAGSDALTEIRGWGLLRDLVEMVVYVAAWCSRGIDVLIQNVHETHINSYKTNY